MNFEAANLLPWAIGIALAAILFLTVRFTSNKPKTELARLVPDFDAEESEASDEQEPMAMHHKDLISIDELTKRINSAMYSKSSASWIKAVIIGVQVLPKSNHLRFTLQDPENRNTTESYSAMVWNNDVQTIREKLVELCSVPFPIEHTLCFQVQPVANRFHGLQFTIKDVCAE